MRRAFTANFSAGVGTANKPIRATLQCSCAGKCVPQLLQCTARYSVVCRSLTRMRERTWTPA